MSDLSKLDVSDSIPPFSGKLAEYRILDGLSIPAMSEALSVDSHQLPKDKLINKSLDIKRLMFQLLYIKPGDSFEPFNIYLRTECQFGVNLLMKCHSMALEGKSSTFSAEEQILLEQFLDIFIKSVEEKNEARVKAGKPSRGLSLHDNSFLIAIIKEHGFAAYPSKAKKAASVDLADDSVPDGAVSAELPCDAKTKKRVSAPTKRGGGGGAPLPESNQVFEPSAPAPVQEKKREKPPAKRGGGGGASLPERGPVVAELTAPTGAPQNAANAAAERVLSNAKLSPKEKARLLIDIMKTVARSS